ncbi:serine/threonine kinase [Pseudomonas synxantha]|uniref:formylglycine-generating enzyme family protein n=1 Tax=Pseudomonas synxantha TaxID=47883 RepID=UPI000F710DC7|nr:SUMF1/EgtB/PvdO family nonheme iron enzyme [Pseudomonas synxantha]AZE72291.1 serine/threonine kinase [Pseudomonas synxantha]
MNIFKVSIFFMVFLNLSGCDQLASVDDFKEVKITSVEMKEFVEGIKRDLVFVEGGEYLMGDYGLQYGAEQLPYDSDEDSRPVHKVKLSAFSIARFKISNKEREMYLKSNGLNLRSFGEGDRQEDWKNVHSLPSLPAHMDWYEAESYCSWLAKVSHLPFALPTEAQWEYAARSRGQFLMVATDDGTYKQTNDGFTKDGGGPKGINISTSRDRKEFARKMGWRTGVFTPLPIDSFPPNPLGLYAMSDNGLEWVKDWYDENYYQYSPEIDPQGPEMPVTKDYFGRDTKVLRGQARANPSWGGG